LAGGQQNCSPVGSHNGVVVDLCRSPAGGEVIVAAGDDAHPASPSGNEYRIGLPCTDARYQSGKNGKKEGDCKTSAPEQKTRKVKTH